MKAFIRNLFENELVTDRESKILNNCLSEKTLSIITDRNQRNVIRASIFKMAMLSIV